MTTYYYRVGNPPTLPSVTYNGSSIDCPKCGAAGLWLWVENMQLGTAYCVYCSWNMDVRPQEQPQPKVGRPAWRKHC